MGDAKFGRAIAGGDIIPETAELSADLASVYKIDAGIGVARYNSLNRDFTLAIYIGSKP